MSEKEMARNLKKHEFSMLSDKVNVEEIIAKETERLSKQFCKTFLDCEDIISLTGLGRDNVRALMNSRLFPVTTVGKREVVSILAFVTWQMMQ